MSNGKIDADKKILQKIYSSDFWFVIPEYQRSYVWQTDNVTELIDDLYYAFQYKPDNEYFLGSLVLKRTQEKEFSEYELLDGQQRLTTFLIMLAVLRDILTNDKHKSTLQTMIYQEEDNMLKIPSRQKITYKIRDKVEEFISTYIIAYKGSNSKELDMLVEESNVSISNMANAILTCKEKLTRLADLEGFVSFILNNALFIYVSTDNTEDAFRMFTILNDRGIPLTSADIIKSLNIGKLNSNKEISKYARVWEDIEGRYGEFFDRFLQFIRTILVKEKARANLLEEFENKIYSENKLSYGKETFSLLQKYADVYDGIIELENEKLSNEYRNLITIMKIGFRSEDWVPPLLYYFNKYGNTRLEEFAKKLEYKFAGDWVCGITPTLRLEGINNILKYIEKTDIDKIDSLLNHTELFSIDKELFKSNISCNIYRKQYSKHLLLKLEYLMSDNVVHMSKYKYISVEHVLPQNPKLMSGWTNDFTQDEREFWTNKIANLVLISKRKNSALSNLDFQHKKEKYLSKRFDVFQANKIFIEANSRWIPDILKDRQEQLINMLISNKHNRLSLV